jgi:hypothetical protein
LRPIPGPSEYSAWGMSRKPAYNLPGTYNATDPLTVGAPLEFFARSSSGTYYLLSGGAKESLASNESNWNLTNYTTVPDYALDRIPSAPLARVFRSDSGTIFTVGGKKKYIFPTFYDLDYLGFKPWELQPVGQKVENSLTYDGMHLYNGWLFKVAGNDTIRYVYSPGVSMSVDSTNYHNIRYDNLITIDTIAGSHYPIAGPYHE